MNSSRVWYFHAAVVALWPAMIALTVVQASAEAWGAVAVVGLVAMAGSLVGYFEEAKHFTAAGSEWVPRWKLWTAAHVVLSPLVAAPLYVVQRWRRVGLQ